MRFSVLLASLVPVAALIGCPAPLPLRPAPSAPPPAPCAAPLAGPAPLPAQSTPLAPDAPDAQEAQQIDAFRLDAAATLRAYANVAPVWSTDRRRLLFRSNRSGTWGAYVSSWRELDLPPDRVGPPNGAVLDASFSRDGTHVLLAHAPTDRLHDPSLLSVDLESRQAHHFALPPFSPGAFWMPAWTPASVLLDAWLPAAGETQVFALTGSSSRVAARTTHHSRIADLDPSGIRMLVLEPADTDMPALREVGVDGAASRSIYQGDDPLGAPTAAAYAPSGNAALVAVRDSAGISRLVRVSLKTQEQRVLLEPAGLRPSRISQVLASARGGAVALALDVASHTELQLLDGFTFQPRGSFSLPLGVGRLGSFSIDGKVLTFSWETAEAPAELFETTVNRVRLRRLRDDARPSLARLDGLIVREVGMELPGVDHAKLFQPDGATGLPVVVRVPVLQEDTRVRWRPEVRQLVAGQVALLEAPTPGDSDQHTTTGDVASELGHWASQQPWADPNTLVLAVDEAQATSLAVTLGAVPWRAVALTYGTRNGQRGATEAIATPGQQVPELCAAPRPPRQIAFWVYQGGCNPAHPRAYSDALVRRLRERGCPAEYVARDTCASGPDEAAAQAERLARLSLFLQRIRAASP